MVSFNLPPDEAPAGGGVGFVFPLPDGDGCLTFDIRSFTLPLALSSKLAGSGVPSVSACAIPKLTEIQRRETPTHRYSPCMV